MFIRQLEYREKPTATGWRRITFPQYVNLTSEDAALPVRLMNIIRSLPAFGKNEAQHGFADGISRMTLQAAHQQFMWFAKSTMQDGRLLVDEEELYDGGDVMLMRRAFGEMTIFTSAEEGENSAIPEDESMLAQHPELDVLQKLQNGFNRMQYHKLTDDNAKDTLAQIIDAQHGTLLLLDGSGLSAPLDVTDVAKRTDLQLITIGCTGIPDIIITQKGKMINCVTAE